MTRAYDHSSTVRWNEQVFLWSCHLYYVEDAPILDDDEFDATMRHLELNRELWSPTFKDRMAFIGVESSLKVCAYLVRLTTTDIDDAHHWAEYVRFLRRFSK